MFRKVSFLALVIALALTAVGMGTPAVKAADPLKIGLLSDQTGALQQYGKELERGFLLGLEYMTEGKLEVAGRAIEVIIKDTANKPEVGASLARELVEKDGAEVLVGSPSSGVTLQLMQAAVDQDVILMAGPAASPAITSTGFNLNTFRACRNAAQDYMALSTVLKDLKLSKVIIFAADYEFGRSSATAAEAAYKALGLEVLPSIFAPLETTDFTPYIQQILDSGADALQPIWAGDVVTMNKQFVELKVQDKLTIIQAMNSNPIMKAGTTPDIVAAQPIGYIVYHYTLPKTEVNDALVKMHTEKYEGEFPDLFTECGFATAQALVNALEASEGDTTPEKLGAALEGLTWEGPRGTYTLRAADHQALMPMYIVRLTNIDDPEFKFYDLVAEIPTEQVTPLCALPEAFKDRCETMK